MWSDDEPFDYMTLHLFRNETPRWSQYACWWLVPRVVIGMYSSHQFRPCAVGWRLGLLSIVAVTRLLAPARTIRRDLDVNSFRDRASPPPASTVEDMLHMSFDHDGSYLPVHRYLTFLVYTKLHTLFLFCSYTSNSLIMADKKKQLVWNIIDFLKTSQQDGTVKEDDKESLDVASMPETCI